MKRIGMSEALLCGVLALIGAAAIPSASGAATPTPEKAKIGTATIFVRHAVTKAPLHAMPVQVEAISADGDIGPWSGITNRLGTVSFNGLPDGSYVASIKYNNQYVAARLQIVDKGHALADLYFNPDID